MALMNGSMNLSSVKSSIYNHRQTTFSSAVPRHTSLRVFAVQTDPKPPASYAVMKTVGLNVGKSKWAPESWKTKKALQQPDLCRTWVEEERMKLLTYNVNGLRQRVSQFDSLLKLLDSFDADIICLQETKLRRQELSADLTIVDGYESFFSCTRTCEKGRTGYSG